MSDLGPYPPPGEPTPGPTPGPAPGAPTPPGTVAPSTAEQSWFTPPAPPPGYAPPGQVPPPYPPAGYPAAGQQVPGYGAPGFHPGYAAPGYPQMMAPAHKPGAIPLRPLRLGDIYDGAFKIIRFNPRATAGSAVLVTAVAMAIPLLITGILATTLDLTLGGLNASDPNSTNNAHVLATEGPLLAGSILQAIGLIFVTGMVTHVTAAAAVGRRLSLAEAWAATRGKRWKLVGLAVVLGFGTLLYVALAVLAIVLVAVALPQAAAIVISILIGIAALCGLVFGWVRLYYLAVPPLMLEPVGVFGAIKRGWRLTRGQFWRTFGIALLTVVMTQVIGSIIGIPFSIAGVVITVSSGDGPVGLILFVAVTGLASVVSAAFVAPFTSAVTSLQYLDQRMRKEGYDVELLTRAGIGRS